MASNNFLIRQKTKKDIINAAQSIIQKYGIKGFSLQALADERGVASSSIYNYFENLDSLACAAVNDYKESFLTELQAINRDYHSWESRLNAYVILHKRVLIDDNKICLCSAIASDFLGLSLCMQKEIVDFITVNQAWVSSVINEKYNDKNISDIKARIFVAGISGLMVNSRAQNQIDQFQNDCKHLIDLI